MLATNWNTVEIYRSCTWQTAATFGGLVHTGISATEIRAALSLHRLPRGEWIGITRGIQRVMVPIALRHLNAHLKTKGT